MPAADTEGSFVIAPDHPALAGHFPDDPIVPGALLLDRALAGVEQHMAELAKRAALATSATRVTAIASAKFPSLLRPGVACTSSMAVREDGTVRVKCSSDVGVHLTAVLETGSAAPSNGQDGPSPPSTAAAGPAITDVGRLLPHQGAMVLLDRIEHWSATDIVCTTVSHVSPDNPLRGAGGLPAVYAIEYGAQAMAAHGALVAAGTPRPGLLASVRNVGLHVLQLEDAGGTLTVRATRVRDDQRSAAYRFTVAGRVRAASGQVIVLLL